MNSDNRIDWFKLVVHFGGGAVLGAVSGFCVWIWLGTETARVGVICIAGGAFVAGTLAAILLDRFWDWVKANWEWLLPW